MHNHKFTFTQSQLDGYNSHKTEFCQLEQDIADLVQWLWGPSCHTQLKMDPCTVFQLHAEGGSWTAHKIKLFIMHESLIRTHRVLTWIDDRTVTVFLMPVTATSTTRPYAPAVCYMRKNRLSFSVTILRWVTTHSLWKQCVVIIPRDINYYVLDGFEMFSYLHKSNI